MGKPSLIPEPRELRMKEGRMRWPDAITCAVGAELRESLDVCFSELEQAIVRSAKRDWVWADGFADEGAAFVSIRIENGHGDEGYRLAIEPTGIRIFAATRRGVFYGVQTLMQLVLQYGEKGIPCLTIEDEPDLALRGMIIDLRFQTYTMDYLIEAIKRMAHYKLNAVLMEYSNKFPYSGPFETIRDGTAFSEAEVRRFVQCCHDRCVEIIPLVQSFGHMEYLLNTEEYRYLREDPAFASQICPSRPESIAVTRGLLEQIKAMHPASHRVCLGCDETFHLGKCPRCSEAAERLGKGGLYVDYVNRLADTAVQLGFEPMIFADMVLAYPDQLDRLDPSIIVGDWDYWTIEQHPPRIKNWATKQFETAESAAQSAEPFKSVFERLLDEEGRFYAFGYAKFLIERGFNTIGLPSTAAVGPDCYWVPQYAVHTPNIIECCRSIKAYGGLGIVNTAWERFLFETTIYGTVLGAEYSWGKPEGGREAFDRKFALLHFGLPDDEAIRWMYRLTEPYAIVEKRYPLIYKADEYGRVDIPVEEIAGNKELARNITDAYAAFRDIADRAARNDYHLQQWMLSAEIKKFWYDVTVSYAEASQGRLAGHALEHRLFLHDEELRVLQKRIAAVLSQNTPPAIIALKNRESFKLYDELKTEMRNGTFR
jgi:hypothetical protein